MNGDGDHHSNQHNDRIFRTRTDPVGPGCAQSEPLIRSGTVLLSDLTASSDINNVVGSYVNERATTVHSTVTLVNLAREKVGWSLGQAGRQDVIWRGRALELHGVQSMKLTPFQGLLAALADSSLSAVFYVAAAY